MIKPILLLVTILICSTSFEQNNNGFEISFVDRYDRHANYVSNYSGRVYNDTNKLYGVSCGVNLIYRQKVFKTISVYFGVGYYKLNVDKIRGSNRFFPSEIRTSRNIDYKNDSISLSYSTSQYHYNNLAFTLGFDKEFILRKDVMFDMAVEVIGLKTLSQKYSLIRGSKYYTTNNNKPLEIGMNINPGVIKEYRKFYLRPSLIIPIYQNLKGDKVFYEEMNKNISKWFNGIGLSLKIGKHF